ncbi:serine hydrolase [Adlercreutzia sp. ZJ154]|uniref:serine hydrolase n=1 Tax=Adlercreutzia sp. ZJ154 TaxID=2709790 RepID=UPI0013EAEBD4|nr:serine hydrolase [Adlercreutzia sp. ZJ154]
MIQKNMLPGSFASSLGGKRGWQQLLNYINKYTVGAVVVIAAVLFVWHPWAAAPAQPEPDPAATEEQTSQTLEEALEAQPKYEPLSPTDFSNIQPTDKETTFGFTLTSGDAPTLTSENEAALNNVLAYYNENDISVGYILMDIGSGRGFARNIDEKIYGASSFKGPFCAYLLMNKVDTGEFKLTSSMRDGTTSKSGHFSFSGKDTLKNMISDTIIYSDNGSFGALRSSFKDENLSSWLSSIGADSGMAYDEWYPHYTARDAARLWSVTYNYLGTNTDGAQLLNDLYSSTETSFMRTAITGNLTEAEKAAEAEANNHVNEHGQYYNVEQLVEVGTSESSGNEAVTDANNSGNSANGDEASNSSNASKVVMETVGGDNSITEADEELVLVRSKAGWYPGSSKSVSSISENGIVTLNGRDYLLCVMTNSYFNDRNTEHMHELVNAVFNLRNDLVPAQAQTDQSEEVSA